MKKNIFFFLFLVILLIPEFVQSDYSSIHSYQVEQNSKTIQDFLKQQDYFDNVFKICHEDDCFAIDVHDLTRSIRNVEDKVLSQIETKYGTEARLETSLKGFSITEILIR